MKISEFISKIEAVILTEIDNNDREIDGIYACDLLSWVMSHAKKNDAWITVLTNMNTVAVALLTEVSCVIIPEGIEVDEKTINKAINENVIILSTKLNTYQICCKVTCL